jgi:hypothetical protein
LSAADADAANKATSSSDKPKKTSDAKEADDKSKPEAAAVAELSAADVDTKREDAAVSTIEKKLKRWHSIEKVVHRIQRSHMPQLRALQTALWRVLCKCVQRELLAVTPAAGGGGGGAAAAAATASADGGANNDSANVGAVLRAVKHDNELQRMRWREASNTWQGAELFCAGISSSSSSPAVHIPLLDSSADKVKSARALFLATTPAAAAAVGAATATKQDATAAAAVLSDADARALFLRGVIHGDTGVASIDAFVPLLLRAQKKRLLRPRHAHANLALRLLIVSSLHHCPAQLCALAMRLAYSSSLTAGTTGSPTSKLSSAATASAAGKSCSSRELTP